MYPLAFSRSSTAPVTTRTVSPGNASSTRASPSGAASRQIAVTAAAPRSRSMPITVTRVPPVASIGSSTKTSRPVRSTGSRFAYVEATSDSSSRTMPTNPTLAIGSSRVMPSSMPMPARSTGTISGLGSASFAPVAMPTGVVTVTSWARTSRVAS